MTAQGPFVLIARYRLRLSFILFIVIALEWSSHARPHSLFSVEDWEHPTGLAILAAGLALRSWAAGLIRKREVLANEGPYALVRHPLYLGSFLMGVGMAEMVEDRFALVAALVVIPAIYLLVIQCEERALAERFGPAWTRYAARTAAVIPQLPARFAWGEWRWKRWWHNREWRVLFRTVVLLIVLEAWRASSL